MPYQQEYTPASSIAADPVVGYMNTAELEKAIARIREEMVEAARKMEFIEAARLRDEMLKMEDMLANKHKEEEGKAK